MFIIYTQQKEEKIMQIEEKPKVPFDPGFSKFSTGFPVDAYDYLNQITQLKHNHQKKFAFTGLEKQLVPIIKLCACFYLGCILWGVYLSVKYKNDNREISGNLILEMPDEEKKNLDNNEIDIIVNFIEKFEKSAKFYLNRSSRISPELMQYLNIYKEFAIINDNFKNLKYTCEIKLPEQVEHFLNLNENQIDELKYKIDEAINSENPEILLSAWQ